MILNYFEAEPEEMTEKQFNFLRNKGYSEDELKKIDKKQAGEIIKKIIEESNRITPRQIVFLENYSELFPSEIKKLNKKEASEIIKKITSTWFGFGEEWEDMEFTGYDYGDLC